MFSGIVEEMGRVRALEHRKNLAVLNVQARKVLRGTQKGDSIAIDGVCLTVTALRQGVLAFDLMKETLSATTLGRLRPGDRVNLERALKADGRVSGHFVTGHVDGVGLIKEKITKTNYTELRVGFPKLLKRYIAPKGSVSVDGVSLTVGEVKPAYFSVHLIPLTLEVTTLGRKKAGDGVNIEADILARYILNNR